MYNQDSSPMIDGCTFSGNSSIYGGGMYNYDNGIPRVEGCTFAGNSADIGGGMCNNHYSSPVVEGCTFSGNSATYDGGGMYNYDNCSPTVKGCTFSSNSAKLFGGGIRNYYSSPMVEACTFNANSTTYGGGMYNHYSSPTVEGCTFSRNWVTSGGGMYNFNSNSTVKSCTFSRNSATWGGGMWNDNSSPNVTNCILWADVQSEILGGIPIVTCSDVQGGWPGEGNINVDPCFADPNNGDYYLKSQAGHWDANSASWIKDDVTSPCIDAGDMSSPIGLEPFPNGGIINMGAYGGTAEASKSYFGEPVCETIVAGDINGDCVVNLADFAFMAYHWLEER
jgi:parallel beta-helix repeat protein